MIRHQELGLIQNWKLLLSLVPFNDHLKRNKQKGAEDVKRCLVPSSLLLRFTHSKVQKFMLKSISLHL